MKYKWHFLPVLLLCISVMFSGCPCNPFHFHSDIEVWLLSPEDGAIVHDTTVTLTWDWTRPSSGKTGHYVIWGTDVERLDWSDLMPGSTKSWPLYNLALSTKYYWRVRSIDGEQRNGTYSETWSFTTGDVVWDHGQVHSPTPDSGAVDVDTIPSFAWQVYNPDSVDFDFDLYLGTSVDPPLIEQGLDSSNFDLVEDTLVQGTLYHWNVVAFHEADTVTGPLWEFTTTLPLLPTVGNPFPADGAIHVDSVVDFSWSYNNPHPSQVGFDFYLGTSPDPPLVAAGLAEPAYNNQTLAGATPYYWKVVVYNDIDSVEGPEWSFTTTYSDDVFAVLEVDARQSPTGYHVREDLHARFDADFAPAAPIDPLQADSVLCEGVKLDWSADSQHYSFMVFSEPIIENGQPVDFAVHGGGLVPNLATSISFPACSLGIISPESFEHVSINGFEITWDGAECGGTVWLTLLEGGADSTGIWKEVANDGMDSLTAVDLQPLAGQTGSYDLIIFKMTQENISAPGYMPQSLIRARSLNVMPQINIANP